MQEKYIEKYVKLFKKVKSEEDLKKIYDDMTKNIDDFQMILKILQDKRLTRKFNKLAPKEYHEEYIRKKIEK